MDLEQLGKKTFFTIGDVSACTGLPAYTIRYWESRLRLLRPARMQSGRRIFVRKDIETLLEIKDMIFRRGFTLAGARKALASAAGGKGRAGEPGSVSAADKSLESVHSELLAILKEC